MEKFLTFEKITNQGKYKKTIKFRIRRKIRKKQNNKINKNNKIKREKNNFNNLFLKNNI